MAYSMMVIVARFVAMTMVVFLIASMLGVSTVPARGAHSSSSACLGGLGPLLVAGEFSGSIDCKQDRLTVRRVGEIVSDGHRFTIYDYDYRLAPACPRCAVHGGHRVIVLRDGLYIGQYKADFERSSVAHGDLILIPFHEPGCLRECRRPVAVSFKANGLPGTIWVGGEDLGFFR